MAPGLMSGGLFLSKANNPFTLYLCKYTNLLQALDKYWFKYYYMYMFKYLFKGGIPC